MGEVEKGGEKSGFSCQPRGGYITAIPRRTRPAPQRLPVLWHITACGRQSGRMHACCPPISVKPVCVLLAAFLLTPLRSQCYTRCPLASLQLLRKGAGKISVLRVGLGLNAPVLSRLQTAFYAFTMSFVLVHRCIPNSRDREALTLLFTYGPLSMELGVVRSDRVCMGFSRIGPLSSILACPTLVLVCHVSVRSSLSSAQLSDKVLLHRFAVPHTHMDIQRRVENTAN